ncbi:MAG: tetraacyldisaccharide 4'-kinase [Bryobacteraceae bacterium]|nr:tetraacyldisaccharide 4'-kinase [Bryobacteraceae bacterium]
MSAEAAIDILRKIIAHGRIRFIYFLYSLAQWLAFPIVLLYLLYRISRDGRYRERFEERLGFLPRSFEATPPGCIWLHAVSVGEVISAVPLINEIRRRYSGVPVFVSTTTLAGRALAEQRLSGLASGIFFAPLDYRSFVRRALSRLRPSLVVVLETEIWPHLYRESCRAGAGLLIVNGRISDKAFPRYQRWASWFAAPLSFPERILAQSERDRLRYLTLGAPQDRVAVAPNLKYDFAPPGDIPPDLASWLDRAPRARVWIAASTMPPAEPGDVDEDDAVIQAFQRLAIPDLLLVVAPRKPERFDDAAHRLRLAAIPHVRRSALPAAVPELPCVLLLDSIGELASLFSRADVVFMGGTLARRGGHNPLEPAFFAKPVIAGPHMENFAAIAGLFDETGAWVRIAGAGELAGAVRSLLSDPARAASLGDVARRTAEAERGGVLQAGQAIAQAFARRWPGGSSQRFGLSGNWMASAWAAGARRNRSRRAATARRLPKPVISVGNITMGGAGKTPAVDWITAVLKQEGIQPAVLTRGYRRRHAARHVVVPAGQSAPQDLTGDEAQILLRRGNAHLGVGADRHTVGMLVEERLHPGVFVLDDGFQHVQLARDLDLVLIDALDPFGRGELFPKGRLREPLETLALADALVITRADSGRPLDVIVERLRGFNPNAPLFRARTRPVEWVDFEGASVPLEDIARLPATAFCGVGNPQAFWRTLDQAGVRRVYSHTFADHHRYSPGDLSRLAHHARTNRAEVLLTTEKDRVNLMEGAPRIAGLPIYWLRIQFEIEPEHEFRELILRAARRQP